VSADHEPDPTLEVLLEHFRKQRGVDLSAYKPAGLGRRLRVRMAQVGVDDYTEYLSVLESDDDEVNSLLDTILINVTAFFRDAPTWEYLNNHVVPMILGRKAADEPIRVWSAGCASGEEAYSIAIVLCEALGTSDFRRRVKVYATDIDTDALATARHATYRTERLDELPKDLVERYFEPRPDGMRFRNDLRRTVVFGVHNLMNDPPISRVDLLLCRNTLMYFTAPAQRSILDRFHFATRRDGILVLGRSEAIASRTDRFEPLDLTHRAYSPVARAVGEAADPGRPPAVPGVRNSAVMTLREVAFEASAAAQLLVDADGVLVSANQQARSLFGLAASDVGRPLHDLELSYRPLEIRSLLDEVYAQRRPVHVRAIEWIHRDEPRRFDVSLAPLFGADGALEGVSVSYVDVTVRQSLREDTERLRSALDSAREELQSAVEELETTNEELQSTNEELETTNEELQSTNEELETMNEELQSTNEELEHLNAALRTRTAALDDANVFLEAIMTSLQSAVVVLSPDMRVELWNSLAEDLWGVRADEVIGEHLMNLDIGLPVERLHPSIRDLLTDDSAESDLVLDAVNRRGRAVRCRVRVAPLRRGDGTAVGIILLMDADDGAAGPHR
jgi:two-component system, chemotaxis family, CheB/CheR fusion protein